MDRDEWGANYYQLFGLTRDATTVQIKRAFRSLSLDLHPDKNRGVDAAQATQAFNVIKHAHDVLVDGSLREVCKRICTSCI
jgi:DnaJ-class molecular chaperone